MKLSKGALAWIIIALVILIDQAVKTWVKTSFYLGEDVEITSWFHLHFIENNGMAFGMEFGPKLFLTLFRVTLAALLIWYIVKIHRRADVSRGYIVCLSLIVAGAIGNIIDCMVYGIVFPAEPGFDTLFHGKVVDMLYFPLFSFTWPGWMPWVGGQEFSFFPAIFNIADAAITVGMLVLVFFYSRQLAGATREQLSDKTPSDDVESRDKNSEPDEK